LDWNKVQPLIEEAFIPSPNVNLLLFTPG